MRLSESAKKELRRLSPVEQAAARAASSFLHSPDRPTISALLYQAIFLCPSTPKNKEAMEELGMEPVSEGNLLKARFNLMAASPQAAWLSLENTLADAKLDAELEELLVRQNGEWNAVALPVSASVEPELPNPPKIKPPPLNFP